MRWLFILAASCGVGLNHCWADPADAVVKVSAWTRFPEPTHPWAKPRALEGHGTGIILDGKRVLTNAHVVLYASEVYVQQRPGGEKFEARVQHLARDIDLALLTVNDQRFFENKTPIKRTSQLPRIKDLVTVYGFPVGGQDLSVTEGEVSRINSKFYFGQGAGLEIQASAPVNPGNSGGPALVKGEMIGVVYSQLKEAQNIGYIIPCEEVDYFLDDVKDGKYDGKPRENTPTTYRPLENAALRRMLKADAAAHGVVVMRPSPGFPLRELDIISSIGPHRIDSSGLVQLDNGLRVSFLYLVPKLARDGAVPVSIIRDGKPMAGTLPAYLEDNYLVPSYQGDPLPYFIHGTMVFVPAKLEDISIFRKLNRQADSPLVLRQNDRKRFPGEEMVVISATFQHRITKGYHDPVGSVVESVNDIPIKNLRHLVETLRASKDEYLKIRLAEHWSDLFVFDRQEMEEATAEILDDNGIAPSRRGSPELLELWNGKKRAP